jgi:hypothetical protein
MFLANAGYLPPHPREAELVFKYLLPLAVPMLLLSANMGRILREAGPLLAAFLLGTATTAAASVAAMALCPLTALGEEGWKIAAALMARHIGGAVNYMVRGLGGSAFHLAFFFLPGYSAAVYLYMVRVGSGWLGSWWGSDSMLLGGGRHGSWPVLV